MTRITFIVLFLFSMTALAQNSEDLYRSIDRKLSVDKTYLDIYSYPFTADTSLLRKVPIIPKADGKGEFRFNTTGTDYSIVFKYSDLENDSIVLLYINEIKAAGAGGEGPFGGNTGGVPDTAQVLRFKDLMELYYNNYDIYSNLVAFLQKGIDEAPPQSLLKVNKKDKEKVTKGISSDDNLDFLSYQQTNNIHKYPKLVAAKTSGSSRGGVKPTTTSSSFQIDGSFSAISFFHPVMDYGFGFVSVEVNTATPVVNIAPWKGQAITGGVRALFSVSGSVANPKTDMLVDARLMGRFHLDMNSFLDKLPFVMGEPTILNVGNGFIIDVKTTGSFNLPFFNAYFAYGAEKFENPAFQFGNKAFFTFTQWETSMSFFWNNSEKRGIRYKMDLGIGGFDVIEADYSAPVTTRRKMKDIIQPMVSFAINFVPNDIEFLGTEFRFFDNHLTSKIWIKLLEFGGEHNIRVEMTNISSSMLREPEAWESKSSQTFMQLRYRYGF